VQRSWRNVERVACLHWDARQECLKIATARECGADLLSAHRWVSTEQEVCARGRIKDHPGFVFSDRARVAQLSGERIIWVHLHRESLLDVKQFD
jgi:hypothetical protein